MGARGEGGRRRNRQASGDLRWWDGPKVVYLYIDFQLMLKLPLQPVGLPEYLAPLRDEDRNEVERDMRDIYLVI